MAPSPEQTLITLTQGLFGPISINLNLVHNPNLCSLRFFKDKPKFMQVEFLMMSS